MNRLKCKICGGQIEVQGDDRGVCVNCGTAYSLDSMRKMFEGIKVSMTGSNEDVEQWRQLVDKYCAVGDFSEAERVVKKILEAVPTDDIANQQYENLQSLKYLDVRNGVILDYSGTARCLKIPEGIIAIEDGVFSNDEYLQEITLPESMTEISENLFSGCKDLKHIVLPSSLTSIGHHAFSDCRSLLEITLPEGITEISENLFSGCINLKHIVLPGSLTTIGSYAFSSCQSLPYISIPDNVSHIGRDCFSDCSLLESINLPTKLDTICSGTFHNCTSLKEIVIPCSVKTIEGGRYQYNPYDNVAYGAFENCNSLESVIVQKGIKTIGHCAFKNCGKLRNVELPEGIINIGAHAFSGCGSLKRITVPDSVVTMGCRVCDYGGWHTDTRMAYAWDGCTELGTIKYPARFDYTVFQGSKYYDNLLREERRRNGLCPECNVALSFWGNKCPKCGKKY